jgi:protein TonB
MRSSVSGIVAAFGIACAAPSQAAADVMARTEGAALVPIHRVDPEFPGEAVRAGAQRGRVTARLTLDASGKVTHVEIVDALPRRLFDRAVLEALADWRYADGAAGRVVEIEIAFRQ